MKMKTTFVATGHIVRLNPQQQEENKEKKKEQQEAREKKDE